MPAPDVIVAGYTTETRTRIFVAAEHEQAALAWKADGGEVQVEELGLGEAPPYRAGVFELENLPPSAVVEYAVSVGDDCGAEAVRFLEQGEGYRLRLLPTDRPLRIGLVSCNGPETYPAHMKYVMWEKLGAVAGAAGVDLLLHCGDQIYADPIWDTRRARGTDQDLDPEDPACVEALTAEFREYYVHAWSRPQVRAVLASVPSVMMWDDHDIADGWGSTDFCRTPPRQALFRAARQAFAEFQASHGPPPIDGGNSFATGFTHHGIAVLMVDTRSHRDFHNRDGAVVVGRGQWDAIDTWLRTLLDADEKPRRLYVVVGVPPVHIKATAAEHLTGALRHNILDDLRDGWSSPRNLNEARALLLRLFNFMADSPSTEVTILAGDVHVGTIGTVRSEHLAHLSGGICNPIYQVTASGMGSEPPSGSIRGAMAMLQGNVHLDLGHTIRGQIFDFPETGECFLGSRNFAVLSLEEPDGEWSPHGNLTVTHYSEDYEPIRQRLHRLAPTPMA